MMTTGDRNVLCGCLRQIAYLFGCFAIVYAQHAVAAWKLAKTYAEHGLIENLQICELATTAAIFMLGHYFKHGAKRLCLCFSALTAFAIFRELDSLLDAYIPMLGWKIGFAFLAFPAWNALHFWRELQKETVAFLRSREFSMMLFALALIIPIAQCLGHKPFLANVLSESHIGKVKEFIEESIETVGYFVLLCSSFELLSDHLLGRDFRVEKE